MSSEAISSILLFSTGANGKVHHVWACDHFKTTLNASEYKRVHRRRAVDTDGNRDASVAVDPDRKRSVVAVFGSRRSRCHDHTDRRQRQEEPAAPQEIVVRPDGKTAYVSCDASKKVAAIDTATWKVEKLIDAGAAADGLAWAAAR